ncbi:MAG: hypothetical protein ACE1ZS_09680 [Candidatus Poribacteria bacterium]
MKPGDTLETLATRVLQREHRLLVETLQNIVDGRIMLPTPQFREMDCLTVRQEPHPPT